MELFTPYAGFFLCGLLLVAYVVGAELRELF
jgi:hypothetical protein